MRDEEPRISFVFHNLWVGWLVVFKNKLGEYKPFVMTPWVIQVATSWVIAVSSSKYNWMICDYVISVTRAQESKNPSVTGNVIYKLQREMSVCTWVFTPSAKCFWFIKIWNGI